MTEFMLHINPNKKEEIMPFAREVLNRLKAAGADVTLTNETAQAFCDTLGCRAADIKSGLKRGQILIIIGGDGTILRLAKHAAKLSVPILGINMGRLGFLSEIEPCEIDLLNRVIAGEYDIEQRMMLDAELCREDGKIFCGSALNEIILTKAKVGNVIKIFIESDGLPVIKYSGDGVIFATPTGSTAYSMSAGGPIVEPHLENVVITPICAHELYTHSFIMSAEHKFSASAVCGGNRKALISVDGGREIEITGGETVNITKSDFSLSLIRVNGRSFNDRINSKFSKV